jgi:hypothetical protein
VPETKSYDVVTTKRHRFRLCTTEFAFEDDVVEDPDVEFEDDTPPDEDYEVFDDVAASPSEAAADADAEAAPA